MNIDDELKPYSVFDQGPPTEAQLKQMQHGMGKMIREFTGNPVGYVEYGGQMLPYPSVYTGERGMPVEHATLLELRALDQAGVMVLPPEGQGGDPNAFRVGSGAQFRMANTSLLGSIQKHTEQGLAQMPPEEIGRIYRGQAAQEPYQGYAQPPPTASQASGAISSQQPTAGGATQPPTLGTPLVGGVTQAPATATAAPAEPRRKAKKQKGWGVKPGYRR